MAAAKALPIIAMMTIFNPFGIHVASAAPSAEWEAIAGCVNGSCNNQKDSQLNGVLLTASAVTKATTISNESDPKANDTRKSINRLGAERWGNAIGVVTASHRCTEEIPYAYNPGWKPVISNEELCRQKDGTIHPTLSIEMSGSGVMINKCLMLTAKHLLVDHSNSLVGRRITSFEVGVPDKGSEKTFKYSVPGTVVANANHNPSFHPMMSAVYQDMVVVKLDKVEENGRRFHVGEKVGSLPPIYLEDSDVVTELKICENLRFAGYPDDRKKEVRVGNEIKKLAEHLWAQDSEFLNGGPIALELSGTATRGTSGGPAVCWIREASDRPLTPYVIGLVVGTPSTANENPVKSSAARVDRKVGNARDSGTEGPSVIASLQMYQKWLDHVIESNKCD